MNIVYDTQTTIYASSYVSEESDYENNLQTDEEEDSLGQHKITRNVSFHEDLEKVYFIPHKSDSLIYCFDQQPLNVKTVRFRPYTDIMYISHIDQKLEVEERCTTECNVKVENNCIDYLSFSLLPSLKSSELPISPRNMMNITSQSHKMTTISLSRESTRKNKTKRSGYALGNYRKAASVYKETYPLPSLVGRDTNK